MRGLTGEKNGKIRQKDKIATMQKKRKKVFVMLSGGVDSSVSALLLQKQGFEVIACHIKGYNVDGCGAYEAADAARIAAHLNLPFYIVNLEKEYKKIIVDKMLEDYKQGITPNPDSACNTLIKFGLFYKKARALGANFVATGHYANTQSIHRSGKKVFLIKRAKDKNKDQSYFLSGLSPEVLEHTLFPLGNLEKDEVRKIAKKSGLFTATKKDSQGMCFLGQFDFKEFLKNNLGTKVGSIIDEEGNNIGSHDGAHLYTIGERKGLKIGGQKSTARKSAKGTLHLPYYVGKKDIEKNQLLVLQDKNHPLLKKKEIILKNLRFHDPFYKRKKESEVFAQIRYRSDVKKARIIQQKDSSLLRFISPVAFPSSGQIAVFYNKKYQLIGNGIII
ncbi:MAG: tRNA 2-thiouridine(34) synthase MnmA [Candidatus Harrisonbacteria bacterium]|nr:tRNA 2-thiouridine(34) synthase MnmA [Candidatus Harrisonbacteria bacterium]